MWSEITDLLTDKQRLLALAQEYLGLRVEQVGIEQDELGTLTTQVKKLERAQKETLIALLRRGFDADDIEDATAAVAADLQAVRQRIAEVEAWAADSNAQSVKVMTVWQLVETASERLANMSLAEQAQVLEVLNVKFTVLDASKNPALRVEGSLCHEKLIDTLRPLVTTRSRALSVTRAHS